MIPTSTRTRIKICGLTREEDVDSAVAAGVDAVGFVRYEKSPRYVSAERAAELVRRLPPFVSSVLLYVNESLEKIQADCSLVAPTLLQFHGDENPAECETIAGACARPWLRAARIPLANATSFDLLKFVQDFYQAQAILLDAEVEGYGGGGKAFQWSLLPPNVDAHLVLSGGLTPANVSAGIRALRERGFSLGVDVSSGVEADGPDGKPLKGIKDANKILQFVTAVRAADSTS